MEGRRKRTRGLRNERKTRRNEGRGEEDEPGILEGGRKNGKIRIKNQRKRMKYGERKEKTKNGR